MPIHGRPLFCQAFNRWFWEGKDCSHISGLCVKRIASVPHGIRWVAPNQICVLCVRWALQVWLLTVYFGTLMPFRVVGAHSIRFIASGAPLSCQHRQAETMERAAENNQDWSNYRDCAGNCCRKKPIPPPQPYKRCSVEYLQGRNKHTTKMCSQTSS